MTELIEVPVKTVTLRATCPHCRGPLTISNEERTFNRTGSWWMNCGKCGLFQFPEEVSLRK